MYKVKAQFNSLDPCPKTEERAWDWEENEFSTLTEAIRWLISAYPDGFRIVRDDEVIAEYLTTHYPVNR